MSSYEGHPTLDNCVFRDNWTNAMVGGLLLVGDGLVRDCVFSRNEAVGKVWDGNNAGAVMTAGSPTLINCMFDSNWAWIGPGGLNVYTGGATLIGCRFTNHVAGGWMFPGAIGVGGASWGGYLSADATLINCVIAHNEQGVTVVGDSRNSTVIIINSTIYGQWDGGIRMWSGGATLTLANSILWGNSIDGVIDEEAQIDFSSADVLVNYSNIHGLTGALGGLGNIGSDPLFVAPEQPVGNLRLQSGSPCIDAGDNDALPLGVTTDIDGIARFLDDGQTPDTGEGIPPIVDMGAHEFLRDCNNNGENDVLDIAEGTSDDCNENLVPDECEEDSDGDGVIGACESCPDDPDKLEPGACGCGVPDNDTDGDGTEDCIDGCPDDPEKVTPGACGCGVPEDDTDGDTVPDCIDQCPGQDDQIDEDQGGTPDCLDPEVIPTVSLWGAAILALLLLAGGKIGFGRRRRERGVS